MMACAWQMAITQERLLEIDREHDMISLTYPPCLSLFGIFTELIKFLHEFLWENDTILRAFRRRQYVDFKFKHSFVRFKLLNPYCFMSVRQIFVAN